MISFDSYHGFTFGGSVDKKISERFGCNVTTHTWNTDAIIVGWHWEAFFWQEPRKVKKLRELIAKRGHLGKIKMDSCFAG